MWPFTRRKPTFRYQVTVVSWYRDNPDSVEQVVDLHAPDSKTAMAEAEAALPPAIYYGARSVTCIRIV